MTHSFHSLRRRTYDILEGPGQSDALGRRVHHFLILLILANVVMVMLETVPSLEHKYSVAFRAFEIFSVLVFLTEYLLRFWSAADSSAPGLKWGKRLRFVRSPMGLVDLLAILPFFLQILLPYDLRFLRVMRLVRILKLKRYSASLNMVIEVVQSRLDAILAGFFVMLVLIIVAASGAYLFEHAAGTEGFGSIPEALWWAIVTLTTVGYGDVVPQTLGGRIFGALVTVLGIGMAALPAGILASGFAEQHRRRHESLALEFERTLEDGVIDADEKEELEKLRRKLGLTRPEAEQIYQQMQERMDHQRSEKAGRECPHCGKLLPGE